MHGVCFINVIFYSLDITKVEVHGVHFLENKKHQISDCVLLGDIYRLLVLKYSTGLVSNSNVKLETPKRVNQKEYKPQPDIVSKSRKKIETLFSKLRDQFRIRNNYAKTFEDFKPRISAKVAALILVQYINKFIFDKPINNIKNQKI